MRSLHNIGILSPESAGPEESHVSGHCHEQKRNPYHIWHHRDPVVSVAFPVASPVFPGLTGMFALMWMSLQNWKDSNNSPCFSAQLFQCLPQFGGLQCGFPWAAAGCHHIHTSHGWGNFWGLSCCAGPAWERTGSVTHKQQTLHGLPPAWQLTWHAQSTHVNPTGWFERPVLKASSGWYLLLYLCQCLRIKLVIELLCWCLCCFSCELCTNSCW